MSVRVKKFLALLVMAIIIVLVSWYRLRIYWPVASATVSALGSSILGLKIPQVLDSLPNNLEEVNAPAKSASADWWLSSGGRFYLVDGLGATIQGDLAPEDKWFKLYAKNNSQDTDGGKHPQNIWRLVTRSKWLNYEEQVYFKINKNNLSQSLNRNASNGIFLFNRYQDDNNLYYTGLRVDGTAVIKKKINGVYYVLATRTVFAAPAYDRLVNPNVLPVDTWLGLKSEVTNQTDGSVKINFYLDKNHSGNWELWLSVIDDGQGLSGPALTQAGHGGLRSDFMDVNFDGYRLSSTK